jgi:hypothetical protein
MEDVMEAMKDGSDLYEVERWAEHAARPGFRIAELQISSTQKVPWHFHTNIQDTFYVVNGHLRLFLREPEEEARWWVIAEVECSGWRSPLLDRFSPQGAGNTGEKRSPDVEPPAAVLLVDFDAHRNHWT